jgi:hypothetical protein
MQKRFPAIKQWCVTEIRLHNINEGAGKQRDQTPKLVFPNRWYYFVDIEPTDKAQAAAAESQRPDLCVVVLMDGSVVTPSFSDASTSQSK